MVTHKKLSGMIMFLAIALAVAPARADIYSYIDKDGTVHFTNISRVSRNGKKWKRIMKTGPGKASHPRGARHDRKPPRDRSPSRYTKYDHIIQQASALYHIPIPLIRAVIKTESDYDPSVVSRAGAMGMMQLMPASAKGMGVVDPFNARQNIFGGVRFLRIIANRFSGDLVLTIAAYHAGSGAVKKYGGIPPYRTTQRYVRMVLGKYYRLRKIAMR